MPQLPFHHRFNDRGPFALLIACVAAFYSLGLGFGLTFAGDGLRILYYIDFIDNARSLLPLWTPQKALGGPVLADPERFMLLGWLLDFSDPHVFLKLGLVGVVLAAGFAAALYAFYAACGLARPFAAFAAFITATAMPVGILFYLGRLWPLMSLILMTAALALVLRQGEASRARHAAIAALCGASIALIGYYALIVPLFAVFVLLWFREGARAAFIRTAAYALAGAGLFAFTIVPLFFYNLGALGHAAERGLGDALAPLWTLPNIFFPFSGNAFAAIRHDTFPHISLILLPGLALLFFADKTKLPPAWKPLALIAALALIPLMASVPPLSWAIGLWEHLPVLSHIRQPGAFMNLFMICAVALAVMGFAAAGNRFSRPRAMAAAMAVFAVLHLAFGASPVWKPHLETAKGKEVLPRETEKLTVVAPDAFDRGYFRVYCDHGMRCPPLGAGYVQGVQGFSLHLSPEAAKALLPLTQDGERRARPQWLKYRACKDLDRVWLDFLNVRYLICDGKITERKSWKSGARFFTRWSIAEENPPAGEIRKAWQQGRVILNADPGIGTARRHAPSPVVPEAFAENEIVFDIEARENGVLFLPEIYSRDWRVTVDGNPAPLLRANGSFRAVAVEKGRHRVVFSYRPLPVYTGLALSLAAVLGFAFFARRRRASAA